MRISSRSIPRPAFLQNSLRRWGGVILAGDGPGIRRQQGYACPPCASRWRCRPATGRWHLQADLRASFPSLPPAPICLPPQPAADISRCAADGVTDPQAAQAWFWRYVPIHCGDGLHLCNSSNPCGQIGRSNFCPSAAPDGSVQRAGRRLEEGPPGPDAGSIAMNNHSLCPQAPGDPFTGLMFHFVNCSARPSGPTTVRLPPLVSAGLTEA